jgi:hypothetical protein
MTIETIDHVETGVGRLSYKLQQENVEKLLTLFLEKSQEIEEQFIDLANQKSIDIAEGVWLDYIGKVVGETRKGLSDADYRTELKFHIGINNADGTPNIIIDLIKQFTNSVSVRIAESGVAFATLSLNGDDNTGAELWDLLQQIRPVSTRFIIHHDLFDNAFLLAYEDNISSSEVFQTTDDGVVFENFEVTLDGINYEPLFVVSESQSFYSRSLVANRNSNYYEAPLEFYVTTDGATFDNLEVDTGGGDENFNVVVPYEEDYIPDNLIPLMWEITEGSFYT